MFPLFACSSYAPQLQFVNGKMVIDTESLAIKRSAMATDIPAEAMEIVEETSMSRVVNSQSYGKKSKSQRWSAEETEKFYNVCKLMPFVKLVICFLLMAFLFLLDVLGTCAMGNGFRNDYSIIP